MESKHEAIPGIWFPRIYAATKHQERIGQIEVVEALSQSDFLDGYARRSKPFVLRGEREVYNESQAMSVLLTTLGEQVVSVRFGDMSEPGTYINRRTEDMLLREFLEKYFQAEAGMEAAYAGSSIVTLDFVRTLKIDLPEFYPAEFFVEPRMWLGRAGTVTALHKDIPDNFAHNYFGTKQWIIYPPRDFPNLYIVNPDPTKYPDFGASQVSVRHPDLQAFPMFANAEPVEFSLLPGDVLYLPAGWSHYVENTTNSLMLNFWLKREKSPSILGYDI